MTALYARKKDDYFSAARGEALALLPSFAKRVLEIGCGDGSTLALLKSRGGCAETVGVERFESAAQHAARQVDRVLRLDIEREPLPAGLGRFDAVLLLDVLEHLVDPWALLKTLAAEQLAPGGCIVISLPNARHFSLVLPLVLAGRFEYAERGILDQTHLRFFTRRSALAMIHAAGLKAGLVRATSLDWRLNPGKLNAATLGVFSDFLASQYLFRCVINDGAPA